MFGENLIQVAKACKRLKPFVADKKSTKEAIKQICLSEGKAYATDTHVVAALDVEYSGERICVDPDFNGSGSGEDAPDMEGLLKRTKNSGGLKVKIQGDFTTEWKRIFTYAMTITKGACKPIWLSVHNGSLYVIAGNDTVQSCFVLGKSVEPVADDARVCIDARFLYKVANLLNELQSKECTIFIHDAILKEDSTEKNLYIEAPGASFVVALIKQSSVEDDESADYEPRETMTFMHKFLDSVRLQEPPDTDEEMQETTADLGFLD